MCVLNKTNKQTKLGITRKMLMKKILLVNKRNLTIIEELTNTVRQRNDKIEYNKVGRL